MDILRQCVECFMRWRVLLLSKHPLTVGFLFVASAVIIRFLPLPLPLLLLPSPR